MVLSTINLILTDFFDEISRGLLAKRVSIEEFAESSEFCGKRLYPRQKLLLKLIFLEELTNQEEDILNWWIAGGRSGNELHISPMIRERIQENRDAGYSHFREVVLVGGRRSSKGFVTGLVMAKKLYDTLQLQDPGLYYGIDQDKEIYFSCIAASQDQAKKYQYADFSLTIARCEALQPNITKIQELELSVATPADLAAMNRWKRQGGKVGRDTSKLRGVALAANASTVRGSATMCACFDEMAFMQQEGESAQTAASVYEALTPSLGQFRKDAMILCNSSPYTKIGKFFERYEDGVLLKDKENGDREPLAPHMFSFKFPSWALFEGYKDDPKKRFRSVLMASPDWNPIEKTAKGEDVYSAEDKDAIRLARDEERQDPDTFKVEWRSNWAEIIDAFLRPEMIDRAYRGRPTRVQDEYRMLTTNWNDLSFLYKYKAHLDPSSTTAGFGFAMGHIEDLEESDGRTRSHVIMDVIQRWKPDQFPEGVVDWETVLKDITRYITIFQPYEITFDQFQSSAPIQWLTKWLRENDLSQIRVYEKTATLQYNWNRAEVFRTALYQGLVHCPLDTADAEWLVQELKHLQQINTAGRYPRVDKQDIGPVQTKDMADCIMEVTEALIGNIISSQTRSSLGDLSIEVGAAGGYQIGGRDDRLDSFYFSEKGSHTFKEMRKGQGDGSGNRSVREQLDSLKAARLGSWSARAGRSGRSGRGRGF